MNWFPFTYILDNLITNSIHAWLTKDYRSSGMSKSISKLPMKALWDTVGILKVEENCSNHRTPGRRYLLFILETSVRQGCPSCAYLFIFSSKFRKERKQYTKGNIHGVNLWKFLSPMLLKISFQYDAKR